MTVRHEAPDRAWNSSQSVLVVDGREPDKAVERGLAEKLRGALQALPEMAGRRVVRRSAAEVVGEVVGEGDGSVAGALVVYVPCRRWPDPRQAGEVARRAWSGGAGLLVMVSSTEICEPSHRAPGMLDEARVRPSRLEHPVARRWAAVEAVAGTALEEAGRRGSTEDRRVPWVVLRAAAVPFPGGDDWVSELFSGAWSRVQPGRDPTLQLLAPPDLARAVAAAERLVGEECIPDAERRERTFHAVPAEGVPLSWALRLAGVRKLPLPRLGRPAGKGGAGSGTPAGEAPSTAAAVGIAEMDLPDSAEDSRTAYLAHPWTASGDLAHRELGFAPRHSSADVAAAMAEGEGWRPDADWWEAPGRRVPLSFDDHGLSTRYVAGLQRTLLRFLHDAWWRVEHRGVENVPRQGPVVLVGVHRGFMPWDGVMALHLVRREVGRTIRFLVHPALLKFPFLSNFMRRLGGVTACRENADRVLSRDGTLGVFPEGIRGAFTPYEKAYRLGNFGRRDYVRLALDHGATLVPFVTVGSAEIYPILGGLRWRWVRRVLEWPYLPLTPTFPWFPVPLPSKWHTRFLDPVDVTGYGGDETEVVQEVGELVEGRMQAALDDMLARRRSWWRGTLWDEGEE